MVIRTSPRYLNRPLWTRRAEILTYPRAGVRTPVLYDDHDAESFTMLTLGPSLDHRVLESGAS